MMAREKRRAAPLASPNPAADRNAHGEPSSARPALATPLADQEPNAIAVVSPGTPTDLHLNQPPPLLNHPPLIRLLQKAYSAEKAAAFAYIGHAGSVQDPEEKAAIQQIETDEWNHRREVLQIMEQYSIPVSKYQEIKFHLIGRLIGASCYLIGWFMPYYFAGRLESGNVCEYFVMMHYFHELGIRDHDTVLYEMGIKEKEHELYFLGKIKNKSWLPVFEKVFSWGPAKSYNDVDIENKYSIERSKEYCRQHQTDRPLEVPHAPSPDHPQDAQRPAPAPGTGAGGVATSRKMGSE
jgi:hypothetical protein